MATIEHGLEKEIDATADVARRSSSNHDRHSEHGSSSPSSDDEKQYKPAKDVTVKGVENQTDPLAHLPDHEQQILKRQLDIPDIKVTIGTLFRYATRNDFLIIFVSSICSIAAGAIMPLMTVIFGQLSGTFQHFFLGTISGSDFTHQLNHFTLYYIYLAVGEFVTTYIATVGFIYTGEHIARKIREHYLEAILRQNVGFFDKLGAGEVTTRITADTNLVQDGISEKVGLTLTAVATFLSAFVIGFVKNYVLTFILCSIIVAIVIVMSIPSRKIVTWNKIALESYAQGGSVAEEVVASIRNATAFSTQAKLAKQYDTHLTKAEYWGKRQKGILGLMLGMLMLIIFLNYALAFWQGSRFLVHHDYGISLSDILTIILAIMIGAFSLGNVAPNAQAFTTSLAAAGKIFSTIDRVSPLDPTSHDGKTLERVEGTLELRNVKHIYPSRPEVVVMEDVSLLVPASKTTALVGSSGSGKSTIVGLVERFYDPVGGQVLLDGVDVRDMNLQFLRQKISLVQQEPTLFGTTIYKNIAHGLIGTEHETLQGEKKSQLIIDAAKMANAHDFIQALPEGYETNVGERGFLLSGGQKQRIAIARAMVSDPKILLLDEATSALDTKSEGVVQAALDKAAQGRTTIIIAHRLSTIKTADNIVVMSHGRIVEQGNHDDLLERRTAYYNLVQAQQIAAATKEQDVEEAEEVEEEEDENLPGISLAHKKSNTSSLRQTMSRLKSATSNRSLKQLERTHTSKSASSQVLKGKTTEEKSPHYSLWTLIKLVAGFNAAEKLIMLIGLLCSIIAGAGQPVHAVLFAKCIVALSRPAYQYAELRSDINFYAGMYFMLAGAIFIGFAGQGVAFAYCSERLIHRVRFESFRTMLRQDITFFDKEENSSGALTAFLSTETTNMAGLSGATLGTLLNVLMTLIGGFILSLAIGWKLALVCIASVPVVLGCGFFRFWSLIKFQERSKNAYKKSASYACEATSAIRTVASLTRESDVWEEYHEKLVNQGRSSLISVLKLSTLYAASQSLMLLCVALGFWYGGTLIGSGEYNLQQFFICFTAVIFGAQSAGTVFSFAPDMSKARHSAAEMKKLFDRVPAIDSWSDKGEDVAAVEGALEFKDVHFRYETRPEVPVLRGLDLSISPGQYVALVGASGCGKSTTVGLLERFYDPLTGSITLDGTPITDINIRSYRHHFALVSQEPTLYQGTVRENILLGLGDEEVDESADIDDRITQACKDANIHNFIISLPEGLATVVGNKGVMLSGGQKQRIAIARALIRNPRILLLDEATSALDSESEKIVQDALDRAAKGRTTVAVAHRLSTIQKADCIFVFEAGRIVEKGTHAQLMGRKGRYFELVNLQSLEKVH
ncbi:MAG: GTPase-activating protein [Chrysothrix sp. TS-e1954]|nr:MAG: GTPase-activating protein [Chrysothrix sp. TS-e1954]